METNPHLFETEKDAFKVIQDLFHQIEECYALEILRNKRERGNYILCHQSRIAAMTSTHAALKRKVILHHPYNLLLIEFHRTGSQIRKYNIRGSRVDS